MSGERAGYEVGAVLPIIGGWEMDLTAIRGIRYLGRFVGRHGDEEFELDAEGKGAWLLFCHDGFSILANVLKRRLLWIWRLVGRHGYLSWRGLGNNEDNGADNRLVFEVEDVVRLLSLRCAADIVLSLLVLYGLC